MDKLDLLLLDNQEILSHKSIIPKLFHFIWIQGEDEMPNKYLKYIESWKTYHPDWTITIWSDIMIKEVIKIYFDEETLNFYSRINNIASKSDFGRYCILYIYGGVYIDTDILCVNNLSKFINLNYPNTVIYFSPVIKPVTINVLKYLLPDRPDIFFIMSSPFHQFLIVLILDIMQNASPGNNDALICFVSFKKLFKKYKKSGIDGSAIKYLPHDILTSPNVHANNSITENIMGIHDHNSGWANENCKLMDKIITPLSGDNNFDIVLMILLMIVVILLSFIISISTKFTYQFAFDHLAN